MEGGGPSHSAPKSKMATVEVERRPLFHTLLFDRSRLHHPGVNALTHTLKMPRVRNGRMQIETQQ